MENVLLTRLEKLENRYSRLRLLTAILILLLIVTLGAASFFIPTSDFDVIRAKGIIIRDSLDRDRILIGAPVPYSANRVRTDTALVRKHWGGAFPNVNQYMEWYSKYKNDADGIIVMNEHGFDRVLVGDKLADANTGKRMFESAGVLWNDKDGWEKGGAGVNTTKDGKARPVMGLDNEDGEAVHIVCLEDGSKALVFGGPNGRLMIGMSGDSASAWFNNKANFTGMQLFDKSGKLLWEQAIRNKQ